MEIKNFEDPPDQSLTENQPLFVENRQSDQVPSLLQTHRQELTKTGAIWLFVPWYLLVRKRLAFSLVEFLAWTVAWGGNSGAAVRLLSKCDCKWPLYVILLYGIFHLHCLVFASALYQHKRDNSSPRLRLVVIPQVLFFALFTFISTLIVRGMR